MLRLLIQNILLGRLNLLPVLVSNLYSLYGILLLRWHVADIFFWFWYDFLLAGITGFVLVACWIHAHREFPAIDRWSYSYQYLFAFFLTLIYATIFAGMAFMGEWKSWRHFLAFLARKSTGLLLYSLSFLIFLVVTIARREFIKQDFNSLTLGFGRRGYVVVGLYLVFLLYGWISTAVSLENKLLTLHSLGVVLIICKLFTETELFTRVYFHRP